MDLAAVLLSPLSLLISVVGGHDEQGTSRNDHQSAPGAVVAVRPQDNNSNRSSGPDSAGPYNSIGAFRSTGRLRSFGPETAWQVRIDQRMTIRVAPRAAMPVGRDMFATLPKALSGPRYSERKIGNCLPAALVVGVEPNGPNNLILFLRDRRMVNAQLERTCLANSFYSGFYLSRSTDGKLCVNRDTLLSRSGSACKLLRIRQVIERDD